MACQLAFSGLNYVIAVVAQQLQIAGCGWMSHHVEVHSRSHKHGAFRREIGGYEHVVGHAIGHFAYRRRCSRGYDHGIGPQTQVDVRVPFAGVGGEKFRYHRLTAQGRQCYRSYELLAVGRDYHLYLGARLYKQAQQHCRFVCRNAPGDAQYYMFTCECAHLAVCVYE